MDFLPLSSVSEACLGQMSSTSQEFLSGPVWPPVEVCGCGTELQCLARTLYSQCATDSEKTYMDENIILMSTYYRSYQTRAISFPTRRDVINHRICTNFGIKLEPHLNQSVTFLRPSLQAHHSLASSSSHCSVLQYTKLKGE